MSFTGFRLCLFPFVFIVLIACVLRSCNGEKARVFHETSQSIEERGLLTEEASPSDILRHSQYAHKSVKKKHFGLESLGFVTPWNGKGYDIARSFARKLDFVSPVWFSITLDSYPFIGGAHDIDEGWIKDLRAQSKHTKIVPRIRMEVLPDAVLGTEENRLRIVRAISQLCRDYRFHGVVLEFGGLMGQVSSEYAEQTREFLSLLHTFFRKFNRKIIFVLPPAFVPPALDQWNPYVYRWVVMTYDFSISRGTQGDFSTGPISPYNWVSQCVQSYSTDVRRKVLLGLHFYGMKKGKSITSDEFLTLVKHNPTMRASYDESTREHVFSWRERGQGSKDRGSEEDARFPTVKSLAERMSLAESLGCAGVSIWELGQGMPMFMDLL